MSQQYKRPDEYSLEHPMWGNCRRGCPPSYLDADGYCSPACHLGAPRGEYVTLPKELEVGVGA